MQLYLKKLNTLYKRIAPYLIATLLLAIPLYPKFPFITIPGTYVGIRLEDFLLALTTILFILGNAIYVRDYLKDTTVKAIILFTIVGLVSVISAVAITQTVSIHLAFLHWFRRIEYMSCFFIGLSTVVKKEHLKFYLVCILVVIAYAFFYGVGQKYYSWPIVTTQNEEYAKGVALRYVEGGHLVATFAGHYDMASYLILTLPVLVAVFASKKNALQEFGFKKYPRATQIISGVVFLMGLWLLTMAASRISIVSFLGSAVLLLLFMRRYSYILVILVATVAVSATSGSLIARYMNIYDVTIKKVLSVDIVKTVHAAGEAAPAPTEDRSTNIRLNIEWPRAIRALERNPLLGTGYSSITLATDNDYLRMLGEIGLLGSFSFALVIISIVSTLFKKALKAHTNELSVLFVAAVVCALPGIFLNMVFIDILEASKFAIMLWLFLGLAYNIARQPKTHEAD